MSVVCKGCVNLYKLRCDSLYQCLALYGLQKCLALSGLADVLADTMILSLKGEKENNLQIMI